LVSYVEFPLPVADEDTALAERVRAECEAQGLPERIEDEAVIARVVTLAYAGSD
jgi:hypothetical protein